MMRPVLWLASPLYLHCSKMPFFFLLLSHLASAALNDWPIIGIYAAPSNAGGDYIAASYVKWIEAAGGRVVPIPYHISNEHARGNVSVLNGLLFPGGGAELPSNAQYMFDYAMQLNKQGDYFPIWGTCLGFEWLIQMNGGTLDTGFDSENITLALEFTANAASSRLFADAPSELMKIYAQQNVTMNNHQAGITPDNFYGNAQLTSFFQVLSTNQDRQGRAFISTIEAYDYPVYGTQWHPEKNQFEWGKTPSGVPDEVINHSPDALKAGAFPAAFFVQEARKNNHQYPDEVTESNALIWNYPVTYTAPTSTSFVQEYQHLFEAYNEEHGKSWVPRRP